MVVPKLQALALKLKLPIRRSLGTRLLAYVLLGSLLGLGVVSALFFQLLESHLRHEIEGTLNNKANEIEAELAQMKQSVHSLSAAVKTLNRQGVKQPESYKRLILDAFQRQSPLIMGLGVGQTPYGIVPDREGFWPYFFLDQHTPDQQGQPLPAPNQQIRYFDVVGDRYFLQNFYLDVLKAASL